jgi:CRISPR/Cas system-associated exonuclease Cas4 (RecB family)
MPYNGKYLPEKQDLYKLSRSKVDFFLNCPRCFYMDRRLGVGRPPGFPFNLNSAVDNLLKNEFDYYRRLQEPHPYIEKLGLNAVPFQHEKLDKWRHNFSGVVYQHEALKLHLFGAVDDIWIDLDTEELIVVDYKATSKNSEVNLDADWQIGYKRQMEFYQYLLRNNGFKVSDTGYFVYCNGIKQKDRFDEKLDFKISLLNYTGNGDWIEKTLFDLHKTLNNNSIPNHNKNCDYCNYILKAKEIND